MKTVTKHLASSRILPGRKQGGVFSVFSWELRRIAGKRSSWLQALLVFALFCALSWFVRQPLGMALSTEPDQPATLIIPVHLTSAWGLIHSLSIPMLALFGLILPFVSAEGVSMDLKRRTHELLMTIPISNRSYLAGRYLAVSLLGLALSCLMLTGIIASAFLYGNPVPDLLVLLELWSVIVLPATLLLGSLSFALGTWLPKHTNIIKALVVMAWIVLVFAMQAMPAFNVLGTTRVGNSSNVPVLDVQSPAILTYWDPTSILLSKVAEINYSSEFPRQLGFQPDFTANEASALRVMQTVEQRLPDLSAWLLPHLTLLLVGPLVVLGASFRFNRFARQLN